MPMDKFYIGMEAKRATKKKWKKNPPYFLWRWLQMTFIKYLCLCFEAGENIVVMFIQITITAGAKQNEITLMKKASDVK